MATEDHQNDSTERVLKVSTPDTDTSSDRRPSKRLDRASTESWITDIWGFLCPVDHQNDSTERVLKDENGVDGAYKRRRPSKRLDRASTESAGHGKA